MLLILLQFSFSFLTATAYAIITNVPRKALFFCGLSGATGWLLYWAILSFDGINVLGTLIGSLGVATISYLFSKNLKLPVTIFNIPGMVPLVPGGLAYQAVRNLAIGNYEVASHSAVQAVMIAGAIALGLILSELFNHSIRNFKEKRNTLTLSKKKKKNKENNFQK